jgi:alginate O-acetyltransferase complex protein AlgI
LFSFCADYGAAWNFVGWGQRKAVERVGFGHLLERSAPILRGGHVLLAVMITWVMLRAADLSAAMHYLAAMAGASADTVITPPIHRFLAPDVLLPIGAFLLAAGPHGVRLGRLISEHSTIASPRLGEMAGIATLFAPASLSLAGGAYNPLLYFGF